MCEVWMASNTLMQKTAHVTFNRTKGRILPALQAGQDAEGADGKEICCTICSNLTLQQWWVHMIFLYDFTTSTASLCRSSAARQTLEIFSSIFFSIVILILIQQLRWTEQCNQSPDIFEQLAMFSPPVESQMQSVSKIYPQVYIDRYIKY